MPPSLSPALSLAGLWLSRLARKLAGAEQSTRVQIARELVTEIRRRTRRINELERQLSKLVNDYAPSLLVLKGCGALSAAKIIAETAGVERLGTDAKFARLAGVAPIPASSGKRSRHRLDRGGNRQLNRALHCIGVTQGRCHPPAVEFLARKQVEGKSKEALRCLKRHLPRRVWKILVDSDREISSTTVDSQRSSLRPQIAVAPRHRRNIRARCHSVGHWATAPISSPKGARNSTELPGTRPRECYRISSEVAPNPAWQAGFGPSAGIAEPGSAHD